MCQVGQVVVCGGAPLAARGTASGPVINARTQKGTRCFNHFPHRFWLVGLGGVALGASLQVTLQPLAVGTSFAGAPALMNFAVASSQPTKASR